MSEPANLPLFLRNPGASYEFVTWLRRFLDDPSSFTGKFGGDGGLLYHLGTYGAANVGDWLDVKTTSSNAGIGQHFVADADAITLEARGDGGSVNLQVEGNANLGIFLGATNHGGTDGGGITLNADDGGDIRLDQNAGGSISLLSENSAKPIEILQFGDGGLNIQDSGNGNGIAIEQAGGSIVHILSSGAGDSGVGILIENTDGGTPKQLNINDASGGGVNIYAKGTVGGALLSTQDSPWAYPAGATKPILLVAGPNGSKAAVCVGLHASDWLCVYDYNSGTPIERFRFYSDGHCQMLNLPTSSAGLASGSLWNNANVVNIV